MTNQLPTNVQPTGLANPIDTHIVALTRPVPVVFGGSAARSCFDRPPSAAVSSCSSNSWMNPRTRSRMPASIGSNQASPVNSPVVPSEVVVLCSFMAWSPPALQRRSWLVEQARDYATNRFHHIRDGTHGCARVSLCLGFDYSTRPPPWFPPTEMDPAKASKLLARPRGRPPCGNQFAFLAGLPVRARSERELQRP